MTAGSDVPIHPKWQDKRSPMKKYVIAFDIDGTLRSNKKHYELRDAEGVIANERIRTLLVCLSSFKNVTIWVWSGGGELYARQVGRVLGLDQYVDRYLGKGDEERSPDIAIDDMHETDLGIVNLIVCEK